jgi:hypothetical protein
MTSDCPKKSAHCLTARAFDSIIPFAYAEMAELVDALA